MSNGSVAGALKEGHTDTDSHTQADNTVFARGNKMMNASARV